MLKKILSLVLALAMFAGVLAGCAPEEQNPDPGPNVSDDGGKLDFNNVTLDLYMPVNTDFEAEGSYVDQAISKTLNLNLVFHELDNFDAQYNPMLAEKKFPSLTQLNSWTDANNQIGEDGAMINILDYLDKMPNVKKYLETEEGKLFVKNFSYKDGVLYSIPVIQSGSAECYGYIYRKDIFDANKMTFPTTQDDFYNTLTKLKSLYPNSYPFVMRQMSGVARAQSVLASHFGISHPIFGIYNSNFTLQNGKYVYAPATDSYKELCTWLKKLLDEDLMHPTSITIDNAGWMEAFASNTSFITYDKMDRIPVITAAATAAGPDFKLVGAPGIPMGTNGRAETSALDSIKRYWQIGNNAQLETTLKYVDWLYTEEGITLTNWGIQGESYTVNDKGEKQINMDFIKQYGSYGAAGLGNTGVVGYKDFDAYLTTIDEDLAASIAICLEKATADRQALLTYNEKDQQTYTTYAKSLQDYALSNISKFITGKRDLSEWDTYVNELKTQYHLEEVQKAHENAYSELMAK